MNTTFADPITPVPGPRYRRYLPALGVVAVVAVFASDWPVGWRFWFDHPADAATAAGLAVLFLTVSVIEAYTRHEQAGHWRAVGWATTGDLADAFQVGWLGIAHLLGADARVRLPTGVAGAIEDAHAVAQGLLEAGEEAPTGVFARLGGSSGMLSADECARRLRVLVYDPIWRDLARSAIGDLLRYQSTVISRWSAVIGLLDDREMVDRIAQTVSIYDLGVATANATATVELLADAPTRERCVELWLELHAAYDRERRYWGDRWIGYSAHAKTVVRAAPGVDESGVQIRPGTDRCAISHPGRFAAPSA